MRFNAASSLRLYDKTRWRTEVLRQVKKCGTQAKAADAMGVDQRTMRRWLKEIREAVT